MKTSDLLFTIIIILIFASLYLFNILGNGMKNIENNWPIYRCNPIIMPFAGLFNHNPGENFVHCIKNMQSIHMKELLEPVHYNLSLMGSIGNIITNSIQKIREFFNYIRNMVTDIISAIYGVFLNILIEIQKLSITTKDTFGKLIGILTSFMYILDGTILTARSTWAGPPGQLVRAICFHPNTLVKKYDNTIVKMKNLELGDKLKNNIIVHGTLKLHNLDQNNNFVENLYSINGGEKNIPILVSGSHLIFDDNSKKFIYVKDYDKATISDINSKDLVCLITSTHTIPLGKHIFHDWEDNNGKPNKILC